MKCGVYRQPAASLAGWAARGVDFVFGYEPQNDANGKPTVTMAAWKAAAKAAKLKYICEPSDNPAADAADPDLIGWLWRQDEPDDAYVSGDITNSSPAAVAAGVATLLKFGKPVVVNCDGWQVQWHKWDYKAAYATGATPACDYYTHVRAQPPTILGAMLDAFTLATGRPLGFAFVECSAQNLDPAYYPGTGAPSAAEFQSFIQQVVARSAVPVLFPQQLPGNGKGFVYDAMPAELVAALTAWTKPTSQPNVVVAPPAANPFAGWSIQAPDGRTYQVVPK